MTAPKETPAEAAARALRALEERYYTGLPHHDNGRQPPRPRRFGVPTFDHAKEMKVGAEVERANSPRFPGAWRAAGELLGACLSIVFALVVVIVGADWLEVRDAEANCQRTTLTRDAARPWPLVKRVERLYQCAEGPRWR